MRHCKHCALELDGSVSEFANHVRWCDKNPKVVQYKLENADRAATLGDQRFGKYTRYTVSCATCSNEFEVNERSLLFPAKEKYFCNRKCANSTGGTAKSKKHHPDTVAGYRTVAWRYHDKKCIVCDETKILAIHHVNENHEDNDPKNLVPMCPTHHQYMHSRYKSEIIDIVNDYVKTKWNVITAQV